MRLLLLGLALLLGACSSKPAEAPAKAATGLCAHGVPAALCTQCEPELAPVFRAQGDWCDEHGVPESQCLKCNPDLKFAEAEADWCAEHGLPESKCTKCNPKLVAPYIEAGDYCREHGFPASVCPICKPGEKAPVFPPEGMLVRLASPETVREAGIETVRAEKRSVARSIEVIASLEFDPNRRADLSAPWAGIVKEVFVQVGDAVKAGDRLAVLSSGAVGSERADLAAARARLAAAKSQLAREKTLQEKGVATRREVEVAEREVAEAAAAVRAAGASLDVAGADRGASGGTWILRAPIAGTVASRDLLVGKSVGADEVLVRIADVSRLQAVLEIPEGKATALREGMPVELRFDGGVVRESKLEGIAPGVDPRTRTIRARAVLENGDRSLRGGLFGRARIRAGAPHESVVVPASAVQGVEGKSLVFVKKEEGVFRPVAVATGDAFEGLVEILEGLSGGEEVVTTGAFLLKTEILKDSIGAGCCEVE